MNRRGVSRMGTVCRCVAIGFWLLAFSVSSRSSADDAKESAKLDEGGGEVFRLDRVWLLHITVAPDEYAAMQPIGRAGFPGSPGGPSPKAVAKRDANRPSERSLMGVEFPWAEGELEANGTTFAKVAIRYSGEASYQAAASRLKRDLVVHLAGEERWSGLATLILHSGVLDPTKARETIAYSLCRAAGVPAPRTAFAEVTLTVPGKYDHERLGLYTLIEPIDERFLSDRFRARGGMVLKPAGLRGLDFLGDDWERYKSTYRPLTEPAKEQADRLIALARLVNRASDDEFHKEIGACLDVEAFLRFLAVNSLLATTDGYFMSGGSYYLALHPQTNRFVFIPGDLERSLGYYTMLGSAEQFMDLSLTRPYPGPNRLTDRLFAQKDVAENYRQIVKELIAGCFSRESLLREIDAIEKVTRQPLAREATASVARKEASVVYGQGGPTLGRPADLRTFIERRMASATAQLGGTSDGYVPRFGYGAGGPPPGGMASQAVNDKTIRSIVQAPAGFDVTLYAAPPQVSYPVAVCASPTGELFVCVDEQGSLGRTPGGGRLLRCVDKDGDGKADDVKVFATMEHPRGVIYQNGSAWVLHPPLLSVFHDETGDGVADRQEVLVTGLTTDLIDTRGGDHTTNGIRMGIDGWIYIAVGDYGFLEAKGKDGVALTQRGGGILRVRPDGTELEVFATGLRNPFDLGIDPYLNLFTRDNTNDGAGWDIRVSHLLQSGDYGYPSLYANFADEILPPLGQFGGGGGTGVVFLENPSWPATHRNRLYTADWGRSEVYRHELAPNGATFDLEQEVFLKLPRPTGMDVDVAGRLYVASWRGGDASVYVGPQVGFIARVTPDGMTSSPPFPNLMKADLQQLLGYLAGPTSAFRLHAQREVLRRGRNAEMTDALLKMASQATTPLPGRVAAVFTLRQLDGPASLAPLLKLTEDDALREFALRALTDRKHELSGLDAKPFLAALADPSPRVRAQALISLGRLGDKSAAKSILPLTQRASDSAMPTKRPVHSQPDPGRILPHLAVRTLVGLDAVDECLAAIDGPYRQGALWAMRSMHHKTAVDGLIKKLGTTFSTEARRDILSTLIRLYHREADYDGTWWGIRPDSTGPYYDFRPWEQSERIGSVITRAFLDGDAETVAFLRGQLARHQVFLNELPYRREVSPGDEATPSPIVVLKADPNNPDQIGNLDYETAARRTLQRKGVAQTGKILFDRQSCRACHTDADGQTPKGPHLVDIGKRNTAADLVESILKPSAKLAQGYETHAFALSDGRVLTGFIVRETASAIYLRDLTGIQIELRREDVEARQSQQLSAMPLGIVDNLTPQQLADLIAYLQSLE